MAADPGTRCPLREVCSEWLQTDSLLPQNAGGGGTIGSPMSSSRSISIRDRPSSCVSKTDSSSKRCMSAHKSLQSSSSSHLQYISTSGSSAMQVARSARREGMSGGPWRLQTSLPAGGKEMREPHPQAFMRCTHREHQQKQNMVRSENRGGGGKNTHPICTAKTPPRVALNVNRTSSIRACSPPINPPP